jgi:ABC-type multidrug transport system fused ATPase/permease subunit
MFDKSRFVINVGTTLYKDVALMFLVAAVITLYLTGSTDIAAIGAVVLLVVRSLSYATQLQGSVQTISEVAPSLESMLERVESLEAAAETYGQRTIDSIGSIAVINASYDYGGSRVGVAGLDFNLDRGDALGVVGPSGSGKSTLVQMLLRLRRPTTGRIEVSGIPYEEIDQHCWTRMVSLVPQEPLLFEATIAENIAFMRDWITMDEIRKAAKDAHVLEDIEALPDGFSTTLGPRGSGLSGGQKQRVAIARALAGNPQLLVLDEPTSALDVRSEMLLKETISSLKGRVTLVIIAHRLSTLECCDRVLVLDAGRPQLIGRVGEALAAASFLGGTGELLDTAD